MTDFHKLLEEKRILVADGAWGTWMIKMGLSTGEIPELWTLKKPQLLKKIAKGYREAGADIILTNTFGANKVKLKRAGIEVNVKQINRDGVQISKEEAGDCLVFASLGPTGEFLEPSGDFKEEDFVEVFSEQVCGFVDGGADGVIIETMSDVKEALCALRAVRENSSLPAGISMSFDKTRQGFGTMMGATVEGALSSLIEENPDIVGANCGSITIEDIIAIGKTMRKLTVLPLWIKPNAGIPYVKSGETHYPQEPEEMASFVPELLEGGTRIIGGCCGTTPEHVSLLREKVDSWRKKT